MVVLCSRDVMKILLQKKVDIAGLWKFEKRPKAGIWMKSEKMGPSFCTDNDGSIFILSFDLKDDMDSPLYFLVCCGMIYYNIW